MIYRRLKMSLLTKPNTTATFPSVMYLAEVQQKRRPLAFERPRFSGNFISGKPNTFHDTFSRIARNQVYDRIDSVRNSDKNLATSGWRNTYPAIFFQPAGSFQMPTNLNGNTGYGMDKIPPFQQGGYRTMIGQRQGQKLLRKRAEQLKLQEQAIEEGTPDFIPQAPSVPLTEETAEKIAVQLTLQDAISTFMSGSYSADTSVELAEPLRKAYQSLLKIGDQFSALELERYIELLESLVGSMRSLTAEYEKGERNIAETPSITEYQNIVRILSVMKAWFSTINIENPKERKRAVATLTKDFSKPLLLETGALKFPESVLSRAEKLRAEREMEREEAGLEEAGLEEAEELPRPPARRPRGRPRLTEEEREARRQERIEKEQLRRRIGRQSRIEEAFPSPPPASARPPPPRGRPPQQRLPTVPSQPERTRTDPSALMREIQEVVSRRPRQE